MLTLVIGGSASGKSSYAERHVCSLDGPRIYIATMEPFGAEARARIEKHKRMRRNMAFETIECYNHLDRVNIPEGANVLLEDLGNLTANEMFSAQGGGSQAVLSGTVHLLEKSRHLTIVTNEVFSGGCLYEGDTLHYLEELARINRILAQRADQVIEMTAGIPCFLKGDRS